MSRGTHLFALSFLYVAVGIAAQDTIVFPENEFPENVRYEPDLDSLQLSPSDINDVQAIRLNIAEADLSTLTSDLGDALEGEVDALESNILSSIDSFQEHMENATQRMATDLQCRFENRLEESIKILNKIFSLTPSDMERIQAQIENATNDLDDLDTTTTATTTLTPTTMQPENLPIDCTEALEMELPTGLTTIKPRSSAFPKRVWCEQDFEGGGWTIMLRREPQNEQLDFNQDWGTYVEGFGDPESEHWIGLETLHQMTKRESYRLIVGMKADGESAFSYYNSFRVGPDWRDYRLSVGEYNESSTGGEAMIYHSGSRFTTHDNDNDGASGGNCADWSGGGGWWYDYCYFANPTGLYPAPHNSSEETDRFIEWRKWKGYYNYLSHITFAIKPRT